MWELQDTKPVKLIIAIMAADENCMQTAVKTLASNFGGIDLESDHWPFTQTSYYKDQTGGNILKKFVSI